MTNPTPRMVDLGSTHIYVNFDEAFTNAKQVIATFDVDVVTFTHRGTLVRVEEYTSVQDAFDQFDTDGGDQG